MGREQAQKGEVYNKNSTTHVTVAPAGLEGNAARVRSVKETHVLGGKASTAEGDARAGDLASEAASR